MIFLESLEEWAIVKVSGLLEIYVNKVNRDYISGYGQYSKTDFYFIPKQILFLGGGEFPSI